MNETIEALSVSRAIVIIEGALSIEYGNISVRGPKITPLAAAQIAKSGNGAAIYW
jgi:hypothetical protein